jgi:PleD family two-component response regulator
MDSSPSAEKFVLELSLHYNIEQAWQNDNQDLSADRWCFLMQVAVGILRRSGHIDVTTVENGQQALDIIAERGGIDAFDLILMDLHMPVMVSSAVPDKD